MMKDSQTFLSFVNLYWWFIQDFKLHFTLWRLSSKRDPKSDMEQHSQGSPQQTLESIHHNLIWKHPDPSKPFILEVDALETGVGAILS